MNITLSIDEKIIIAAREAAAAMKKNLNEIIREDLERLAKQHNRARPPFEAAKRTARIDYSSR